jgi:hypothetical protein
MASARNLEGIERLRDGFSLGAGAHVCHLYEDPADLKSVVLPFLVNGSREEDCCYYVTCSEAVDNWCFELQASGVDVEGERSRGALTVTAGAHRAANDRFNSIAQAAASLRLIGSKLAQFPSLRMARNAVCAWDPPLGVDDLCHWEATANFIYKDQEVRVICTYDLRSQTPAEILAALRTHPLVILAQRLYSNPFYEAPRILAHEPRLNHSAADHGLIAAMLEGIQSDRSLLLQSL